MCWCQVRQETVNTAIDHLFKILTMVIRAQDGHAEFRLSWNVHNISVNCEL